MKKQGSAILPMVVILSIISALTALYLTTHKNSAGRLQSRTYKTDIESIRTAVRAAVEDPFLCSDMLRGQVLPQVATGPGAPVNSRGVPTRLNMSYGPLPGGAGPLEKGWPKNAAAPKDWATIGDVRLWTDGKFLGYVVLARPSAANNPLDQWYEVYEARILIYGVQGQVDIADPNSRVGYGSGLPPTPNSYPTPTPDIVEAFNSATIPIIVHVKYRANPALPPVIASCYAPTSYANFCRMIDNYKPDSNPKITGGYDTFPPPGVGGMPAAPADLPQWSSLTAATYTPYRCHPETCVNLNVGGGIYKATDGINCPKPYISQRLGSIPSTAGVDRETCLWCNQNRNAPLDPIPGGVTAPPVTQGSPPPCAADFLVTCLGTSTEGTPPVVYSIAACEDEPDPPLIYVSIMRGPFGTGWVNKPDSDVTLTYSPPGDVTSYTLTSTITSHSVTLNGTPSSNCIQTGNNCLPCTASKSY